jgi:hypothetical protein
MQQKTMMIVCFTGHASFLSLSISTFHLQQTPASLYFFGHAYFLGSFLSLHLFSIPFEGHAYISLSIWPCMFPCMEINHQAKHGHI